MKSQALLRAAIGAVCALCLGAVPAQARSISITNATCTCNSGGGETITGDGQLVGDAGDTVPNTGAVQLKYDGGLLTTSYSLTGGGPWNYSATADRGTCDTGNHKIGAHGVLTDSSGVNHTVDVPAADELTVNCS